MQEEWKQIEEYQNYQVSNYGRVKRLNCRNTETEHLLKPSKDGRGYLHVCLCKDGKKKWKLIHRLAYETFKGPIPEGHEINHIDEDKTNNFCNNLNLMSHKENINHGTRNERVSKALTNHPEKSKPVLQLTKDLELVKVWPSTREVGRNGFNQGHVVSCCNGKLKSHKGFIWQYAKEAV